MLQSWDTRATKIGKEESDIDWHRVCRSVHICSSMLRMCPVIVQSRVSNVEDQMLSKNFCMLWNSKDSERKLSCVLLQSLHFVWVESVCTVPHPPVHRGQRSEVTTKQHDWSWKGFIVLLKDFSAEQPEPSHSDIYRRCNFTSNSVNVNVISVMKLICSQWENKLRHKSALSTNHNPS